VVDGLGFRGGAPDVFQVRGGGGVRR
jgi:hypothetical protein